jgi:hypothetical protein
VKASGKNYILFNIWRFYKEKEDFRRYHFISYRNSWIENEGGETMSDENIRYRHSSGSNGRNGHRPASAGIYCSLWESKLQEIMVRLDHLIYWTAIYSSN